MEMREDLWRNALSRAGNEIVEILTFTRANRAQVKVLEEDISLIAARVRAAVFTNARVQAGLRLTDGVGSTAPLAERVCVQS